MEHSIKSHPPLPLPTKKHRQNLSCFHTQRSSHLEVNQCADILTSDGKSKSSRKQHGSQEKLYSESATTLDDASSITDQSSSIHISSPIKSSAHDSDRSSTELKDIQCPKSLATLTITERESIYVRALFRYEPDGDRNLPAKGLPFEHGDILYVVNASDPEWWQARYAFPITSPIWHTSQSVNNHSGSSITDSKLLTSRDQFHELSVKQPLHPGKLGIIPSLRRVERRTRIQSKRVQFIDKNVVISTQTNPFLTPSFLNELQHSNFNHRFFSNGSSIDEINTNGLNTLDRKGSISSLNAILTPYPNGDSFSIGGTLERKKKNGPLSILKRFSSRRDIKRADSSLKSKCSSLDDVKDSGSTLSRSYEIVRPMKLSMARPLILFGPLKDEIADELLSSEDFATCVQHTSRPMMPHEVDGVDFHFCKSKAVMQEEIMANRFLDAIISNDHFYAFSIQSVVDVLKTGKICILDVSIPNIYRLHSAGLYPITILLKPDSMLHWRELKKRSTVDQARRMYEACLQFESQYWYMFTAILGVESIDTAVGSIYRILAQHYGPTVWLADQSQAIDPHLHPPIPPSSEKT